MTDRTNRLGLAAAEALHALAEALTDWAEDGLPGRPASDRHAANEERQRERQREEELEDAWQSRDWETVRRLQDEAERQEDVTRPDPLDEYDPRDRLDGNGRRWTRRVHLWCPESCACSEGGWKLDELDGRYGPLTFAPDAAPDAPRADLTASEAEGEARS